MHYKKFKNNFMKTAVRLAKFKCYGEKFKNVRSYSK